MTLPDRIKRAFHVRRSVADQVPDEVDAEIRFHLESRIEELEAAGHGPEEAERLAVAEFGDVAAAKRALGRVSAKRERSRRRMEWLEELSQDLRLGSRRLVTERGFAAVAVTTLALGIGANTAIFSVVHAVLLRPLPYPAPERLVSVWEVSPDGDDHNVVSRGNYMDWRDRATSFTSVGAYGAPAGAAYRDPDGGGTRVQVAWVTPELFRALGVTPAIGRLFSEEEGVPGSGGVAVVSHGFWRDRLGGAPDVVGRGIQLDGSAYTVVGVMPREIYVPRPEVDAWVPWVLGEEDRQQRRSHNLQVLARLAPGISVAQAQGELDAMAAGAAEAYPEHMTGWGVNVQPYRSDLVASTRPLLLVLLGVVGLVLLLACANLANLLTSRALAREREVAVRAALGARRGRLVRQLMTEAALLAVIGGGLGFGLTAVGLDVFIALAPDDIPLLDETRVDPVVMAFAVGATFLATLLFGLLPAVRATSTDVQATLRASGGRAGRSHERARSVLLVAEVALAVLLLVGAGLLLRSVAALQSQDYGFDREGLLTGLLNMPSSRYPNGTPDHVALARDLVDRLEATPGVLSAAGSTDLPAGFGAMTFSFAIEGQPASSPSGREEDQPLRIVTPGYFETLRIPLIEGRTFSEHDDADAPPVLVINEALRRRHWPDGGAVGARLSFAGPEGPWLEIVGVVGDTRHYAVDAHPAPALYMPHAQKQWEWTSWLNVLVRTEGEPESLAPAFRAAVAELDPEMVPGRIASLVDLYAETNARRRFATVLIGAFALLALVLGVVGVYGVLSYSVARRTRELGIRMALGAARANVAAQVVARGAGLALAGAVIGVVASLALSRFLESLVYGVGVRDPVTLLGVPLLLLVVAAAAAYVPARRATRVAPMEALREE